MELGRLDCGSTETDPSGEEANDGLTVGKHANEGRDEVNQYLVSDHERFWRWCWSRAPVRRGVRRPFVANFAMESVDIDFINQGSGNLSIQVCTVLGREGALSYALIKSG